jgi:hypothetical protein
MLSYQALLDSLERAQILLALDSTKLLYIAYKPRILLHRRLYFGLVAGREPFDRLIYAMRGEWIVLF